MKAFLFDLDGVLVDFTNLHMKAYIEAWNTINPEYTINVLFHSQYLEALSTKSKIQKCNLLLSINNNSNNDNIFKLKQELTNKMLETEPVYSFTRQAIQLVKEHGYKVAVCSNSIHSTILKSLERIDIVKLIDCILSNEDVSEPKPSPEIYKKAMDVLNVSADDCVIFEDSEVGKKAASRALEGSKGRLVEVVNAMDITPDFVKSIIEGDTHQPEKINIVIPMAGLGSRFQKEGYTIPKPFLPVFGKPMYRWVIDNILPRDAVLRAKCKVFLLVRKEQEALFKDEASAEIHTVPALTEGAACTVLSIKDIINSHNPLVIANSDQFLEWDSDNFYRSLLHPSYDGAISSFEQYDPSDLRWSYAHLRDDGTIEEVAEKKYIGPIATTGIYSWKKGCNFVADAEDMIAKNIRVNNEFYVCPVYNESAHTKKYRVLNCKKMWGLGVPSDYTYFIEKYKVDDK
jgi:HAD superfamily hydrolase (TIGR01509 family)